MKVSLRDRRSGIAAMWSLVIVSVVSMMSATAIWQFTAARRVLDRREHLLQARWLARSGLELAAARLVENASYGGELVELFPDSAISITVNSKGDAQYHIRSEGLFPIGEPAAMTNVFSANAIRKVEPLQVRLEASPGEVTMAPVRAVIETEFGDIEIELYPDRAPGTVANFLRYVDAKKYDGARFHRTVTPENQPSSPVKIEVIQAGVHPDRARDEFPPIKLERTRDTRVLHTDGTLSMARDGPDTATGDFFICIGDQPELDFGGRRNPDGQGFAAFGRVIRGMDVVKKIHASPVKDQSLTPAVAINSVRPVPQEKK